MNEIIKPNFIIIGAMKAATTSLYTYLKQHPDVFMTSIKEPMFFNSLNTENDFVLKGRKTKKIKSFEEYYSLFKKAENETAIGEASPAYISNNSCAKLIKDQLPNTKIIAILRQPVERAYSNFLHAKRADREPIENFEDAFNAEEERIEKNWSPLYHYKTKGHYYQQLKRYFDLFTENQIKVILFKDVISNPQKVSKEVFDFLEVDNSFTPNTSKKANVSGSPSGVFGWIIMKMRRNNLIPNLEFSKYLPSFLTKIILSSIYTKPEILSKELINKLTNLHYKEDIKKLENLIKTDLSHWL